MVAESIFYFYFYIINLWYARKWSVKVNLPDFLGVDLLSYFKDDLYYYVNIFLILTISVLFEFLIYLLLLLDFDLLLSIHTFYLNYFISYTFFPYNFIDISLTTYYKFGHWFVFFLL